MTNPSLVSWGVSIPLWLSGFDVGEEERVAAFA
jgi:hypothetical protein